jgi:outer membrane protein
MRRPGSTAKEVTMRPFPVTLLGVAALGLALGAAPPASAEVPEPSRAMTLGDALAFARAHQPAIRAAMARIAAQTEEARVPRAEWLPSVGATAQIFGATSNNTTGTFVGAPFMDVPRIGGSPVVSPGTARPYASTFVGAGIQQEVFDFGRIAAHAAAEDALVDVARHQATAERLDIDFSVEEAYFAVYAAKSVLSAAKDAEDRSRVHRDLAKAGVDAGLRSPVELTRAEADLARFTIEVERARAAIATAQSVLAATVGVPEPLLDTSGGAPSTKEMPSLSDAVRDAAARDPFILEAEARVRAEEKRTRAIASDLRPDLSLSSTLSLREGGAPPSSGPVATGYGLAPYVPNYDLGIVLRWPLWSGPVAARERASRSLEQVRREELGVVRFQRSTAVQQCYLAVGVAKAVLPMLERAVGAARANYDQADARFKSGLGNAVELADAEALRTQAEIGLIIGRFELARARVAFGRAIAEEP